MIETLTISSLASLSSRLSGLKEVKADDDSVMLKYRDHDGDIVAAIISLPDEEKATASLIIKVPESHLITAMIVANFYNCRKDTHGTFAYATKSSDNCFIIMETHINVRGGAKEENVRQQLRTFVDRINHFEGVILEGIKELGPDTDFIKGGDDSSFWSALGSFAEGVWEAANK